MAAPTNQILIVEPEEELAKQLGDLAKKAVGGCEVVFCKEGYKAAVRMESTPPFVLVTGHELHKSYTGRKLMETVLRTPGLESTAVVVVGGADFEGACTEQVATGQLQFVPKPFSSADLEQAIIRASSWSRAGAGEFQVRVYQAGECLFREGDLAEHAYLVKSGKLRAFLERNGKIQILGEIAPGEFVGEMSYIDGTPRSANVDALATSEVIEIPVQNLDAIVAVKPAWSKALLRTLSRRLKGANLKKVA